VAKIAVVQFGFPAAARNFRKLGDDAVYELKDVMEDIVDDITEVMETTFNSEGRRGGGSWKRPGVAWAIKKARTAGADQRIGHFTRRLRRSLTYRGDPEMLLNIDTRAGVIRFGSRVPYAAIQNQNRPFLRFTQGDRERWASKVAKKLAMEFKGRARKRRV